MPDFQLQLLLVHADGMQVGAVECRFIRNYLRLGQLATQVSAAAGRLPSRQAAARMRSRISAASASLRGIYKLVPLQLVPEARSDARNRRPRHPYLPCIMERP